LLRGCLPRRINRPDWYGYSAYQLWYVGKLLAVFRTFYNYCIVGQDGKTPAMRLGLGRFDSRNYLTSE
jgi:hypothetical protein